MGRWREWTKRGRGYYTYGAVICIPVGVAAAIKGGDGWWLAALCLVLVVFDIAVVRSRIRRDRKRG